MRKLNVLLIAGLCAFVSYSCSAQGNSSKCDELPSLVAVDALDGYVSPDEGQSLIKMNHNDEGVLVQLIVKDRTLQQKFLMQGLTMYIDLKGKKNTKYGITFPKANPKMMFEEKNAQAQQDPLIPSSQQKGEGERPQRGPRPEANLKPLIASTAFDLSVFTSGDDEFYFDRQKALIEEVDGYVVYAFTIPYDRVGKKLNKKRQISIGVVCEQSLPGQGQRPEGGTPPGGSMSGGPGGGMPPSGTMGGGPGGGGPGGGRSGRPGGDGQMPSRENMREMGKGYNQWIVFTL